MLKVYWLQRVLIQWIVKFHQEIWALVQKLKSYNYIDINNIFFLSAECKKGLFKKLSSRTKILLFLCVFVRYNLLSLRQKKKSARNIPLLKIHVIFSLHFWLVGQVHFGNFAVASSLNIKTLYMASHCHLMVRYLNQNLGSMQHFTHKGSDD